jgi:hypothetical protein
MSFSERSDLLNSLSLVVVNFADAAGFAKLLQRCCDLLGGKPGEVVVVNSSASADVQTIYWQLFQDKLIDKLQIIRGGDESNPDQLQRRDYIAGAIASKPYLLLWSSSTLPQIPNPETWIQLASDYLKQAHVFAVSGAGTLTEKHSEAEHGWYYSNTCDRAFTLLQRDRFIAAHHELGNDFILAGFTGENPALAIDPTRSFSEVAFGEYMTKHNLLTVCSPVP